MAPRSSTTSTSTTSSRRRIPAAQPFTKKAPVKNRSRERFKDEIVTHRRDVAQLQAQLVALERHHADENRRLRAKLWRQIVHGRRVIAALTGETPEALGCTLFSLHALKLRDASGLHDNHGRRLTLLIHELPWTLSDVSAVFNHALDTGERGPFLTKMHGRVGPHGEEQLVLESRDSEEIALDLMNYCRAFWKALGPEGFGPWDADVRAVGSDVWTVRLRGIHPLSNGEFTQFTASMAFGRFTHGHSIVITWRAVTTADSSDSDLYIDETGWTLLTPRHEGMIDKRGCVQWVPRSLDDFDGQKTVELAPRASSLVKLTMEASARYRAAITEVLENALIDDCMREA